MEIAKTKKKFRIKLIFNSLFFIYKKHEKEWCNQLTLPTP